MAVYRRSHSLCIPMTDRSHAKPSAGPILAGFLLGHLALALQPCMAATTTRPGTNDGNCSHCTYEGAQTNCVVAAEACEASDTLINAASVRDAQDKTPGLGGWATLAPRLPARLSAGPGARDNHLIRDGPSRQLLFCVFLN